ncbi:MAPEG family protein [Hyphomicrobium sp.]|uniref:MAPEG family protein n=1 Tax=Hyphomicrobium sp. TaxID=82 RepID=UPI002FDE7F12
MNQTAILYPVFVQVALTFFLQGWMRQARRGAIKRGEVAFADIALRQSNWPPEVQKIANAFHNQLETPPLFYALVAFLMITGQVNLVFVVLAWVYVAARLAHAYVHLTINRQPYRSNIFIAGSITLLIMWLLFAIRILFFTAAGV